MAGGLRALFGGKAKPPDPDPLPGVGGYALGEGPYGATGFPGSTAAAPKTHSQALGDSKLPSRGGVPLRGQEVRQVSYRGDERVPGAPGSAPRQTPRVRLPRSAAAEELQANDPDREFFGGQPLKSRPGFADNIGGNPLGRDGKPSDSVRDTETPMVQRQPQIGLNTPGGNNVRNQITQRVHNPPGQLHTYLAAPRGELAGEGGGARFQVADSVTVPSRFVFAGGGQQTYFMERRMPYVGGGDGARGGRLNGTRYYGTGQEDQFLNAGAGSYGYRAAGRGGGPKRPVSFTEPPPWTAGFYDTTPDNPDAGQGGPGTGVHVSPQVGRSAMNRTGRE